MEVSGSRVGLADSCHSRDCTYQWRYVQLRGNSFFTHTPTVNSESADLAIERDKSLPSYGQLSVSSQTVAPLNNSWLDKSNTYKYFLPPAERIRKLKLKFRYHSGQLVDFNGLPFSILLEFNLFSSQQVRKQNVYNPQTGK